MNMTKIEKDMDSPEVKATLQENLKLAEALGMNGTPSYVVGNTVVVGADGELDGRNTDAFGCVESVYFPRGSQPA